MPGYQAPQDTIGPATRVTNLLGAILVDGCATGALHAPADEWLAPTVAAEMAHIRDSIFPGVPPTLLARGLIAWTELFGAVSFEIFNRLDGIVVDRDAWFEYQVIALTHFIGALP